MSNPLVVAGVTTALRDTVQEAVQRIVPAAKVRVGPPRAIEPSQGPEVCIYLYQIAICPQLRNRDLPTRDPERNVIRQPQLPLDLHYVVAFSGEADFAAERMMGGVIAHFHGRPGLLLRAPGPAAADSAPPEVPTGSPGFVKVIPNFLTIDELSKLWTVFFQIAHRPSLQYVVGPVLIDAEESLTTVPLVSKPPMRSTHQP